MFKKRYVAAAACALAMVGTANAVYVNPQGLGDFLIGPGYFIGGGLNTDLKVINTSNTESVVAKVVFRHPVTSQEILDFMIYLSPSDVWTGNVSCLQADAAGNCEISRVFSTDDSIQLPMQEGFASADRPFIYDVNVADFQQTKRLPLPNQGYFEVEMSRALSVANRATGIAEPGVSKVDIYNAHRRSPAQVGVDETPDTLLGMVTVNAGANRASLPMLALAGYDNAIRLNTNDESGLGRIGGAHTPIADVEEALWTNNFAVPYTVAQGQSSLLTFTFPTKLTFLNWNWALGAFQPSPVDPLGRQYGLKFVTQPQVCLTAPEVFNNSENVIRPNISPRGSSCVNEFDIRSFGAGVGFNINTHEFTEGWVRLGFEQPLFAAAQVAKPADTKHAGKAGVPAIVTYMEIGANGIRWSYAPSN